MVKVTAPDPGLNGYVVGLTFRDGVAEVDELNRPQALWLARNRYTVDGGEPAAWDAPDESWTKQRIEEYAATRGVDLTGAATKADMLAAVNAA